MLRRLFLAAVVASATLAVVTGILAYWTVGGAGSATASVGTLTAPGQPTRTGSGSTVDLSWTASSVSGGGSIGYHVERRPESGSTWSDACGTTAASPTTSTGCTDTPAAGTHVYRVTASHATWTAVSPESDAFLVVATDATPPYVVSVSRGDTSPTNAASVSWIVTFSESVTGVDAGDFALVAGVGLSGASLTDVTGTGPTRTVTASTGSGDGSLRLDVDDDDTIHDGAGNPLGTSGGSGDGGFTGETYAIDKTAPSVTVEQKADQADPANTLPIHWTVTFSEPVEGFDEADLTRGGTATGGTVAVTGSGADYEIALTGSPTNGTMSFSTAAGGASDLAGNVNTASTSTDNTATYDTVAPSVTDVTSPKANGAYTVGELIPVTVTLNEPVNVTGVPQLLLETGATDRNANYTAGSGTMTLTFNYTVQAGDTSNDLDYVDASSLSLNGGTIKDAATNNATPTLPAPGATGSLGNNKAIVIDTTPPTIASIDRTGASDVNTGPLGWIVTFSEPVNGVTTSNFAAVMSNTGGAAPTVSSATPSGGAPSATWTVSVSTTGTTGQNNGSIGLNLTNTSNVKDVATNNLSATTPVVGQTYAYDTTAPTVTVNQKAGQADPANTLPILFTVSFSEPVTAFDAADLTRGGTATGGTVTVTGSGAAYEISVTDPGATLTNGTITFSIAADKAQDAAGNNNTASTSTDDTVTYDATAPALSTLQMFDDDHDGKVDRVAATFNETLAAYTVGNAPWTLTGVPSNGSLDPSFGTCSGGSTSGGVCVQGAVATLKIAEGAGAADTGVGSFSVALAQSAAGIRDAAGNQASFSATAPQDKAAPVPVQLVDTNGANDGRFEQSDTMTVTFSESVVGVAASSNVSLIGGNGSNQDTVSMSSLLLGTPSLNRTDYITGNNRRADFNGSSLGQPQPNQVRVTLAACSGDCASPNPLGGAVAAGNFTFTPVATITDAATNPATGSITTSIRLF